MEERYEVIPEKEETESEDQEGLMIVSLRNLTDEQISALAEYLYKEGYSV